MRPGLALQAQHSCGLYELGRAFSVVTLGGPLSNGCCLYAGDKQTLPNISNFDCNIGGVFATQAVPANAVSDDVYAEHPLGEVFTLLCSL